MHRVFLFHERGVKGSSRCSVATMATFCLLSACKDAPLGQRQGGVFRFPPPYLWPSGASLHAESKQKVAIVATLHLLLPFTPLS